MNILLLASLHKHFLAADAVKQLLFMKIPVDSSTSKLSPELQEVAQQFSSMLRLQVFYALIYVVGPAEFIQARRVTTTADDAAVDAAVIEPTPSHLSALPWFATSKQGTRAQPIGRKKALSGRDG